MQVEGLLPALRGGVFEGTVHGGSGIVDEDIRGKALAADCAHELIDPGRFGHIALISRGAAAAAQLPEEGVGLVFAGAISEQNPRAFRREGLDGFPPDASRAPGNQRNLIFQFHLIFSFSIIASRIPARPEYKQVNGISA